MCIRNDKPIIPAYNVNAQGSGDMYPKGGNLLHSIRHGLNNDELFRSILRGLNAKFYHQTVTSAQVEAYISATAKFNYSKVFDQYLRTVQIPTLNIYLENGKVFYKYTDCVDGFNLPISFKRATSTIKIFPTTQLQHMVLKPGQEELFTKDAIEKMYYLKVVEGK